MKNLIDFNPKHIKLISFDAFDTLLTIQRNHWIDLLISRIDTHIIPFNAHIARTLRERLLCENSPALAILQDMQLILPKDISLVESHIQEERESIRTYLFVEELLIELRKRYQVAVISNLGHDYGEKARSAIGPVDYLLFSYEVGLKKPDPSIFKKLIKDSGLLPYEILHIGNNLSNDYLGAIDTGIHAIHLDLKKTDRAKYRIYQIQDLISILL